MGAEHRHGRSARRSRPEQAHELVDGVGVAEEVTDAAQIRRVAKVYDAKYPFELDPSLGPIFAVRPRVVFGQIERANLFILPLDNRREWYRYHHLFADLLRQRFAVATRKLGLNRHRLALDCDRFQPPAPVGASAALFGPGANIADIPVFPSPAGAKASSGVPFASAAPAAGAYGRGARQLRAMVAGQLSLFD